MQCGHFHTNIDIRMKAINILIPAIDKKFIDKNPPMKQLGIDRNRHNKENFLILIRFLPITFIIPLLIMKNILFTSSQDDLPYTFPDYLIYFPTKLHRVLQ